MGKIRTVKPELFRHVHLFETEKKYQLPLRLAFIALLTCCDREGRFRWEPRSLKLDILPYDDIDFAEILEALWAAGFIKKYLENGKSYGYIPSWNLHQSINKNEPLSKLPSPKQCASEISPHEPCQTMPMQPSAMQIPQPALTPSAQPPSVHSLSKISAATDSVTQVAAISENSDLNQKKTKPHNALHVPIPEMHRQARATHRPAPEKQIHTSLEVEMEMEVEVEKEVEREWDVEKEMEKTGNLGSNPNLVAPARQRKVGSDPVFQVFNFWKTTFNHPQAILDTKRQRLIKQALQKGYSVAQLCDAVSGCSKTPHNLGDNERGQRFDGLHIILRDSDQIERFMRNHHKPPSPSNTADKLIRANANAGKNWLNKKISGDHSDAK